MNDNANSCNGPINAAREEIPDVYAVKVMFCKLFYKIKWTSDMVVAVDMIMDIDIVMQYLLFKITPQKL